MESLTALLGQPVSKLTRHRQSFLPMDTGSHHNCVKVITSFAQEGWKAIPDSSVNSNTELPAQAHQNHISFYF